jgi:hypothetical protein
MVAEDAQPQNKFARGQMQCSKPCIVRRTACILHIELLSMESKNENLSNNLVHTLSLGNTGTELIKSMRFPCLSQQFLPQFMCKITRK